MHCTPPNRGKVRVFRTVNVHETVFPFLLELRKSVPHALTFAPKTVEEVEALELEEAQEAQPSPMKIEEIPEDSDKEDDNYDRLFNEHKDQESEVL